MNLGWYALPSVALTLPMVYESSAFRYERVIRVKDTFTII